MESHLSLMLNNKLIIHQPDKLICLLHKFVTVNLKENQSVTGFVDFIDSSPYCIGVIEYTKPFMTKIIPGHAILSISEIKPKDIKIRPITIQMKQINNPHIATYLKERKKKLLAWLREVCKTVPIREEGENIVIVDIIIFPPYTSKNVLTTRPTSIINKLKIIIEYMPEY